jgi:hypothetical protein
MNILIWHVHGSWTTAFVQGSHTYLVPVTPDRGPDGRGRARTWDWPQSAIELTPDELSNAQIDVVVAQRPHEMELVESWARRRPGRDIPLVYLEHNTPGGPAAVTRHPLADRDDAVIVHVTAFNQLMWDCGTTRTAVIEHGVIDPGHRYTGTLGRAAVVVNEPLRRARAAGTDLIRPLSAIAPLDIFGMGVEGVPTTLGLAQAATFEDLPQRALHNALGERRVYLHLARWTSLGLSLVEAMLLGMPVIAVASTAVPEVVPPEAGIVSADPDLLRQGLHDFIADPERAFRAGLAARQSAVERFALDRFLKDWEALLGEVTG